jgi:hypothetical protein
MKKRHLFRARDPKLAEDILKILKTTDDVYRWDFEIRNNLSIWGTPRIRWLYTNPIYHFIRGVEAGLVAVRDLK